jgi:hemerythrin superfamily protein
MRSSARKRTQSKPDAVQLLKDDHRKVGAMFDRYERTRGSDQKQRLASTICEELKVHTTIEEEIFYPAVREAIGDDDLMNEALVEHASAKDLIGQIEGSSPSDENYDALVKVLGEYIKHHVKEEESDMFKQARQSELDLGALGERMMEHKRELTGKEPKGAFRTLVAAATGR